MPILFALFATLRGSPLPMSLHLEPGKVLPADQIAAVETKPFNSASHSHLHHRNQPCGPVIASLEARAPSWALAMLAPDQLPHQER